MTPSIFALVGKPGSGKTTLLEKLIPELNRRNLKVGTIKHHVHEFEMDREGKDTWRHKNCGAHTVALSSPTGLGVISSVEHDHIAEELLDRYFHEVDLVIAEGYKKSLLPKIEVFRKEISPSPLDKRDDTWIAIISNDSFETDLPRFTFEDVSGLADFIIENLIKKKHVPCATLIADGKPIALNNFLEKFIRQAVTGMVTSLKGCSDAKEITLTIKRKSTHE